MGQEMSKYQYLICLIVLFAILFSTGCNSNKSAVLKKTSRNFWVGDTTKNIHGIDISHHQEIINWDEVKKAGVSFVFVKSTEGIDYLDTMFLHNWTELEKENMIRGAYHFYVSDDNPVEQAEWFVKNVGNFSNVLPPVVDVERAGHDHIKPDDYISGLMKCLVHIEKLTGRKPLIYSSPHFAEKYLTSEKIGGYELWIAEYEVEKPTIPEPWQKSGWKFWQNTFQDTIPGVPVRVDRNIFAGKFGKLVEMVE